MKYKIIATDLDGTLLVNASLHPDVIKEMKKFVQKGGFVVFVTGRSLKSLNRLFKKCNFSPKEYSFPHAVILEEKFIYLLRNGDFKPVKEWNDRKKDETAIMIKHIKRNKIYKKLTKMAVKELGAKKHHYLSLEFASEEMAKLFQQMLSIALWEQSDMVNIIRNRNIVNLNPVGAGKGKALMYLINMLGIDPSQVLTIGDSHNDIEMLRLFPSATVSNAEEEVKSTVLQRNGYIAKNAEGKGVIEILNTVL